jgi:hypothetical protein
MRCVHHTFLFSTPTPPILPLSHPPTGHIFARSPCSPPCARPGSATFASPATITPATRSGAFFLGFFFALSFMALRVWLTACRRDFVVDLLREGGFVLGQQETGYALLPVLQRFLGTSILWLLELPMAHHSFSFSFLLSFFGLWLCTTS